MSAIERSNESTKVKRTFFINSFTPPFTLFNATTAFLSFVSAAIIPNRRSKGRGATSIITLTQLHASLPTSGGLIFIDDIRFSTFACKLHTRCKGSRSFLGLQPVLEPLAKLQYRRYNWDSSPKGHCILYTLPFICDVDSLLPSRFGAIATAAPLFCPRRMQSPTPQKYAFLCESNALSPVF